LAAAGAGGGEGKELSRNPPHVAAKRKNPAAPGFLLPNDRLADRHDFF
jgi:hypothetical protein